jgi:hypothetical protein
MIVNVSLPWTTNNIVFFPSFYAGGHYVFSYCCVVACGPTWIRSYCAFSWTSMILDIISSCCASAMHTTSSPLSWTLSATISTSSSVRVMTGSSVSYFLFLCTSFSCVGFLIVCEGCDPLVVPWVLSSLACEVSFFPFYG